MFKIGEEVICINNHLSTNLTIDNVYVIINISNIAGTLSIKCDDNNENWYMQNRFKLDLTQIRKQKLKKLNMI